MTLIIDVKEAMWLTLVIKLKAHGILGDKDVGEVHVPVKNLLDNYGGAKDAKHMSCS